MAENKKLGRQKIEIKKIENRSSLRVTFSKRRSSLFSKASELSNLCGVDTAVLVESPGGKIFTFGTPSVDTVINRYLALNIKDDGNNNNGEKKYEEEDIKNLAGGLVERSNVSYQNVTGEVNNELFWWNKPIDELGLEELEEFKNSVEGLKGKVMDRAKKMADELLDKQYEEFCSSSIDSGLSYLFQQLD